MRTCHKVVCFQNWCPKSWEGPQKRVWRFCLAESPEKARCTDVRQAGRLHVTHAVVHGVPAKVGVAEDMEIWPKLLSAKEQRLGFRRGSRV